MRRAAPFIAIALLWAVTSLAQQPGESEDDGFLVRLIQNALSAPGREVDITGISGVLSSQATIDRITVSDDDGIWLEIDDVAIDWSRAALFRRVLSINELAIGSIKLARPPLPAEAEAPTLEDASATPFQLPELPLEVRIDSLALNELTLGEAVMGQAATLSAAGSATLAGGEIDASLAVERQDPPGGQFNFDVAFSNDTRILDVDLAFSEPEGGLVATALGIEGRPAIDLALTGSGPLDDIELVFALDAAGDRLAAGTVSLDGEDEGLGFVADFRGMLAPLVPADYRPFFAGETAVLVDGVSKDAGGVRLDRLEVDGAELTLSGGLETGADGFLRALDLTGAFGDPRGEPVTLPVPGGATTLNSGTLYVRYGEGSRWDGGLGLDRLAVGEVMIEDLTLAMGGLAQNLGDPAQRNVTINLEGLATGIWAEDPDLRRALGDRIDLFADVALPPDEPIRINQLQVSGSGLSVFTAGTLQDLVYSGRSAVRLADIRPLSGLAGRRLGGGVNVRAEGDVALTSGGFDLALGGIAQDLRLGEPRLNALLAGTTELSGRIARDEDGIRTDALRVENEQIALSSSGVVSAERTDIGFEARLADLALVVSDLSGALTVTGTAEGQTGGVTVSLEAAVPRGSAVGLPLTGLEVGFDGRMSDATTIAGALRGTGQLGGSPIALEGDIAVSDAGRRLSDFVFAVGPNRLAGDLAQEGDAPLVGSVALDAPQVATLAALAGIEAAGSADADIGLFAADVGQGVRVLADVRDLSIEGNRIGRLALEAAISDAFGVPLADASLSAGDLLVGGVAVESLSAQADTDEDARMAFSADALLAIGTEIAVAGALERLEDGFAVELGELVLTDGIDAQLAAPTRLTLRGGTLALEPLALAVGDGRLEASGTVAEELDLALELTNLPLGLANAVQPELGLTGTLNGTASIGGTPDAPDINFEIAARDVGAAFIAAAGLPTFALDATGQTDGSRLLLDAALSGNGISARTEGAVPLDGGALDLDVALESLPLTLIDGLAGNLGLQGTVTGTAELGGTLAAPTAAFTAEGSGLNASILQEYGLGPFALSAAGAYDDLTLTLASASLTGAGGVAIDASGTVPFEGAGLDLAVSGTAPLSLANFALAERTAQAAGEVSFDLQVSGALTDPQITGPITTSGATFVDPQIGRLDNISLAASLTGDAVVIDSLTASSAYGGTVSGSGQVGLGPGLPAELSVTFSDLGLSDGSIYTTSLSGGVTLTGPITGEGGLVAGQIALGQTEISVAEGLGANAAAALQQITHVNTPRPVARTLERARVDEIDAPDAGAPIAIGLDLLISAPNQIFIRGRGLDAELGGELRVTGTTGDIVPVGEFNLIRGRLAILGQRIVFDEGSLQLVGDFNPQIRFVAQTEAGAVTAFVTVEGRASSPQITFSSVPERPQDEVLALVLFNRSVDDLSPFQLAQLAAAAAELAGASGNGLIAQLRGAIGLDDLDIITEDDGSTAVRAGRYLSENVYFDVQTGSQGAAQATINLDITERLTARGSVETDGNSTVGIFFERDY